MSAILHNGAPGAMTQIGYRRICNAKQLRLRVLRERLLRGVWRDAHLNVCARTVSIWHRRTPHTEAQRMVHTKISASCPPSIANVLPLAS